MERTCRSVSFRALMIVQFIGAFNDNAFRVLVFLFAVKTLAAPQAASQFVSLASLAFILPYIFLSPLAGALADRFPKRSILIAIEVLEIVQMVLGFFALLSASLWLLAGVFFLLTVQNVFLSPAKYGMLPEILQEEELSRGNGFIQAGTFLAVILSTVCVGVLSEFFALKMHGIGLFLIALAVLGLMASFLVRPGAAALMSGGPRPGGLYGVLKTMQEIGKDQGLFLTMLGLGYFAFVSTVFQMNIFIYGSHVLRLGQAQMSLLLGIALIGITTGGLLAGWFSEKKIELGLVPIGAAGICFFSFVLGFVPEHFAMMVLCLFLLGMSAGFYSVPLSAFYQRYSPAPDRGKYLAALNVTSSLGIILASGYLWLFGGKIGLDPAGVFLVLGVLSVFITLYIVATLPLALVRFVNWVIAHSIYHLKVVGLENVPDKGGALIIANHISFADAVFILACLKRHVRFIMNRQMYELPIINMFCRALRIIPIDQTGGPKAIAGALEEARRAIESGELVCIFPEGHLTRTGNMLPFRKGFEHIVKGLDVPVVPVYLDNVWGSVFSYADGKYFWKIPKATRYPVSLVFGKPLASTVRASQVRVAVQELSAEANIMRGLYRQKLHLSFIDEVKRHTFCFCMADSTGTTLKYFEAFVGAMALSRTLFPPHRRPKETNEMVGVLLPSSCAAAMANLAVAYAGKVPVNLNFTLSKEAFDSCVRQCNMKTILTARVFIEKIGMAPRPEMVFLEDIRPKISKARKIFLAIFAVLLPAWALKVLFVQGDRKNVDDVATVIFSSGSTGEPKGVLLTHANIFSNIESFYQIFDVKHSDVVMGALPFFHSFGFTATLCFPIGTGIAAVYHANPIDAGIIGKLVQRHRATMIMGTPTFMSTYVRKCTKEQFATVRLAVVGAEKLKESLAQAFYEKFHVMPYEGYGATELSPIVSVGFPDYVNKVTGERQVGYKVGKVGHPIPGVAVKVVDPDTFAIKDSDEEGLLLVKGANVMKGYLNNPAKTSEVLKDGWYVTGDIAMIDSDGFVKITDRLSRFSKIGGEMVPHIKIEENIMEIIGAVEPVVAVTSVGDEKKGERLVVLHAVDLDAAAVCGGLSQKGLTNLWIPKKEDFYRVEAIPLLGTGKVDLKKIKQVAEEVAAKPQPPSDNP